MICWKPEPSLPAEDGRGGHAGVVERQLRGFDALVAELVELLPGGEAGGAGFDQERRDAAVARLCRRVRLRHDEVDAGALAVRHPHLLAVDDVFVAVAAGDGLDRLGVGARVWLGDAQRAADLGLDEAGQEGLLLRFGSVLADRIANEHMGVDDSGEAHPAARQLHADARVGLERKVEATVLLRDLDPKQAHLRHALDECVGVFVGVLVVARHGLHFAVDPGADVGDDLPADGVDDVCCVITGHEGRGAFRLGGGCRAIMEPGGEWGHCVPDEGEALGSHAPGVDFVPE